MRPPRQPESRYMFTRTTRLPCGPRERTEVCCYLQGSIRSPPALPQNQFNALTLCLHPFFAFLFFPCPLTSSEQVTHSMGSFASLDHLTLNTPFGALSSFLPSSLFCFYPSFPPQWLSSSSIIRPFLVGLLLLRTGSIYLSWKPGGGRGGGEESWWPRSRWPIHI